MTAEPAAAGHQGIRSRSQHQRRRRIVQAGAALASRGGVEAMQMRTVADRAGVALGTLYRYFPSKMDLVVAVVSEEMDTLEGSLDRRPPRSGTPSGRAVEVLMRATRGLMREPELADALIRSLLLSDVKTDFGERMAGMLARAAGDGATRESAASDSATRKSAASDGAASDGAVGDGATRKSATRKSAADDSAIGDEERRVLLRSLASVWVLEMIEMLRAHATNEQVQARLEIAADRLLAGF